MNLGTRIEMQFPNEEMITKYLSTHPSLYTAYEKEKGLADIITKHTAEQFANKTLVEEGVLQVAKLVMLDIQRGEDGFTRPPKKIPKVIEIPDMYCTSLIRQLVRTLIKCPEIKTSVKQDDLNQLVSEQKNPVQQDDLTQQPDSIPRTHKPCRCVIL